VTLKLIEFGVPKELLSLLSIPLSIINILWPFFLAGYIIRHNKVMIWYRTMIYKYLLIVLLKIVFLRIYFFKIISRLFFVLVAVLFVYLTPSFRNSDGNYPSYYFVLYFCFAITNLLLESTAFVSIMGFWAQVSDPTIGILSGFALKTTLFKGCFIVLGGTYMTLLGTIYNLGKKKAKIY
jgi:PAT family acetyl-CoA transporter-like MFS transporter 1